MLRRIVQAAVPILLVIAGMGTVAFGVWGHAITVVLKPEEAEATAPAAQKPEAAAEEEEPEPPPQMPPPGDPWMSPPRDPWMGGPPRDPWMGSPPPDKAEPSDEPSEEPAAEKPAEKPIQRKTSEDLEPIIIRDVTVGGVSRSELGEIVRTYVASAGGKPPALCPT